MDVTGQVDVGYSHLGDGTGITIGGGIQLTSPAGTAAKLQNVGGQLDLSLELGGRTSRSSTGSPSR